MYIAKCLIKYLAIELYCVVILRSTPSSSTKVYVLVGNAHVAVDDKLMGMTFRECLGPNVVS